MFVLKVCKPSLYIILLILVLKSVCFADTEYKVKSSDTLSGIVERFYKGSKLTQDQIYIGLLAENPDAFSYGNINYLKGKQRLILPKVGALLVMEKRDAANLVAAHNDYASQGNKVKLQAPFEGYKAKSSSPESEDERVLAGKQQTTNQALEKLDSETEELRIRLKELEADKESMDAELRQLDSLINSE